MSRSIVEYFFDKDPSSCGYCKNESSSISNGMWAHIMTVDDYQDLIDRGWRRSGKYCYKPTLDKTCCPQYTIRTNALDFRPSKSQKKVIKRFRKFVVDGLPPGKERVLTSPPKEDLIVSDEESSDVEMMEKEVDKAESKLKMSPNCSTNPDLHSQQQSLTLEVEEADSSQKLGPDLMKEPKHPKPGIGADPDKPLRRKAKDLRKEKAIQKMALKGKKVQEAVATSEKSLEDLLLDPFPATSKHKFETRLLLAQTKDKEFMKSYEESLQVYRKYQVKVHKDKANKCTSNVHQRFLCDSSLVFISRPFKSPITHETLSPGYGAFHQQYLLDGKIICVAVIDILPRCLSSVYLYYDPDYSFLSLGTLSALFEILFVRQLARISPDLDKYYMGFYIHSCPKMTYKAKYLPSEIACPETFQWVPVQVCIPLLDKSKYSRLSPALTGSPPKVDLENVNILHRHSVITYARYRQLAGRDDEDEVLEYATLVGNEVSQRMMLYRS